MGSHSTHSKKEDKKKKKGGDNASQSAFSTRPVFVPPTVIKKDRNEY